MPTFTELCVTGVNILLAEMMLIINGPKLLVLCHSTDAALNCSSVANIRGFWLAAMRKMCCVVKRGNKILFAGWTEAHYLKLWFCQQGHCMSHFNNSTCALYHCIQEMHTISNQLMGDTTFLTILKWAEVSSPLQLVCTQYECHLQ